jgi:hypothetical protein
MIIPARVVPVATRETAWGVKFPARRLDAVFP